jgi:hypothetical protein
MFLRRWRPTARQRYRLEKKRFFDAGSTIRAGWCQVKK